MKYETLVKLHKIHYRNYNWYGEIGFEPKEEYTIFDLINYSFNYPFLIFFEKLFSIIENRKKWIVAKK